MERMLINAMLSRDPEQETACGHWQNGHSNAVTMDLSGRSSRWKNILFVNRGFGDETRMTKQSCVK